MRSAHIRKDDATAAELAAAETSGVERSGQTAVELRGKRRIRYFVSYSNKDRRLKDDLLDRLTDRLAIAKNYRFEAWQDKDIELGSDWHGQIQAAISNCDFGLLLVSPAFLATPYIADYELPKFVADDPFQPAARKCVAPVALKPIRFDGEMDLRGLEQRQIFRDRERRAYEQRTGNKQKDEFVDELFAKIIDMLNRHLSEPSGATEASLVERSIGTRDKLDLNGLPKFSVGLQIQPIKQDELFELKDLLRDVEIPDDRVDTLFHQILPDSRDFDVASGQSHFLSCLDFLAKKRHARPDHAPLLEFLERCRDVIAGQLSEAIETIDEWTARVSHRLDVDLQALKNRVQSNSAQKANSAEPPVLLVKIAPKRLVSETEFTVTAWCRHGGKDESSVIAPRTVRRDKLGAEVKSIIERVEARFWNGPRLRLETILPIALFDWNPELPAGPHTQRLGALYQVKVRSWERTYHPAYIHVRSKWPEKWRDRPKHLLNADHIRILFNDDIDCDDLFKELNKTIWVLLTLCAPSKDRTRIREIFGVALAAGLPFVFWPLAEHLDFEAIHEELRRWLLQHSTEEWPNLVYTERGTNAHSYWNDFLMLWDDPEHLPPDVEYQHSAPGQ